MCDLGCIPLSGTTPLWEKYALTEQFWRFLKDCSLKIEKFDL